MAHMGTFAVVALLALSASAAAGAATDKQLERASAHISSAVKTRVRAAPPLWNSGLQSTWESVGNPVTDEGVTDPFEAPKVAPAPPAPPAARSKANAGNRKSKAGVAVSEAVVQDFDSAEALAVNPLLDEAAPFPRYADVRPHHVAPAARALIANLKSQLEALEAPGLAADYAAVMHPLERITDRLEVMWGVVMHLKSVRDSAPLRAAVAEVQPAIVDFQLRLGQSRAVYDALTALRAGEGWDKLDRAQKRAVELQLKDLELGGVALGPKDRARFNAIQQEMAQLGTTFANNVLDSTARFMKLITNKADVAGMLETDLGRAALMAQAAGHKNASAEAGPWLLTIDGPSYAAVVSYADNRHLREEVFRAYLNRASEGRLDNTPVIERMLALRRETALILGYPNYAEMSMAVKMATLPTARALMDELRNASWAAGARDTEDVRGHAKSIGHAGEVEWWDVPYYAEKLRASKYSLSDSELRPYLGLPSVLDGMFKLVNRLFGIDVVAADGKAQVWHPDVRFFEVRAANGTPISYFYLDPYSRPSEKRGGAWMNSVISRSRLLAPAGKAVRLPVALAVTNHPPPVGGAPSLMTLGQVETLFHEFGHTLQHMLTTVDEGLVSGLRGVPWDAVELASQFMENWVYDRPTLASFAKHHATGEPLPDALYAKVMAAKNFRAGWGMLRQVAMATKDLVLYSDFVPGQGKSIYDVDREVALKSLSMAPLKDDKSLCSFGHIFTGGYSAGYYSYKWSEVLSADAFAAFEEAGLGDEAAVKATGRRYADTVLALGGSVPPTEVYKEFRGRGPTTKALLRHSGLAK